MDTLLELLTFDLAAHRFALPLVDVQEVLRAVAITRLPGAPSVIEGMVDVRGRLIPVVDVRRRVGLPRKQLELEDRLIVVQTADRALALRVDRVQWTVRVDPSAVQSTRESAPDAFYLAGIVGLADGLVLIHDLGRFLSPSETEELIGALESFRGGGA